MTRGLFRFLRFGRHVYPGRQVHPGRQGVETVLFRDFVGPSGSLRGRGLLYCFGRSAHVFRGESTYGERSEMGHYGPTRGNRSSRGHSSTVCPRSLRGQVPSFPTHGRQDVGVDPSRRWTSSSVGRTHHPKSVGPGTPSGDEVPDSGRDGSRSRRRPKSSGVWKGRTSSVKCQREVGVK